MPGTIKELLNEISKQKIPNFTFIYGEEPFFIEKFLDYLKDIVVSKLKYSYNVFYSADLSVSEILADIEEVSMFNLKKVIVIKNFGSIKEKDRFLPYLERPNKDVHLFLVENSKISFEAKEKEKTSKKKTDQTIFYKKLSESNFLFESKKIYEKDITNWVIERFKKAKITISTDTAVALYTAIGYNLYDLENEIVKILAINGDSRTTSKEEIEKMIFNSRKFTIFDMYNFLHKKDFSGAAKIGLNLLSFETGFVYIVVMLTKYFSNILMYNQICEALKVPAAISRYIGTSAYYLNGYEKASLEYKKDELKKIFLILLEKDLESKTTNSEDVTLFISLMAEIDEICKKK